MLRAGERLIVVGPTPPPIHGVSVMVTRVVAAVRSLGLLAAHLDTRDPRPIATTDRLDLRNLYLGVRHLTRLLVLLARHRGAALYVPISQGTWGLLRDAAFIWAAALFGRRVIVHLHGGLFRDFAQSRGRAMRWLIAATMRRVDEAWVLTPAHEGMFEGLVPASRVKVLENAVDDIGAQIDADGPDESWGRLLYLSMLVPEKGCLDLLEALESLGERARGVELRFAGEADRSMLEELRRRGTRLAANDVTVRYEGVVSGAEKLAAFAWAQVFVLPTRYPPEGQPLVLLEAMSAALAIVTTSHSGIPFTVRDGEAGLLVPPGDVGALARAIDRLLGDSELRARLAAGARRRYADAYRPEAFRDAIAELLSPTGSCAPAPGTSARSSSA